MPDEDESFDPYRFGHPDVPPPPEFAPPGYRPPAVDLSKPSDPPSDPASGATPYPGAPPAARPYDYGPPPGYPSAPYPPYHPYQYRPTGRGATSGKAVAGLVLGILAVAFFWLTLFDLPFIILGVVFSLLGLAEVRDRNRGGRTQAIVGLVCAGVGAVLALVTLIVILRAADSCGGIDNQDAPGFNQCVTDHVF